MSEKRVLVIDNIEMEDFNRELGQGLIQKVLNDETIDKIKEITGLKGDMAYRTCDEFHAHEHKCVEFYHPVTAIVDRLLVEIYTYQRKLDLINKESDYKNVYWSFIIFA